MPLTAGSSAAAPEIGEIVRQKQSHAGVICVLFLVCGAIAIGLDTAPRPVSDQASLAVFSAKRAVNHVAAISRAPHPINSAEHDRVRDYILATLRQIGMTPQVQKNTEVTQSDDLEGAVENIVCRLPGSTREKAVLLLAHYDSVAAGPGASDDGVAVAALLESARALKLLPQLRRDVIFLFTDGEELGLLGARAFVSEHPWVHDVGVVLNFEARGTTGPSIMFETSSQNGWLISNFGRAASHPVANSLSYEIYKRMPNDTDFSIFRRAGYSGLNFAFIDGLVSYHTPRDSIDAVDLGSLQHHGDYMMELTQQFGNAVSDDPKDGNAVYFDVLGLVLVRYRQPVSIVLLCLTGVLFVVACVVGVRKRRVRLASSLLGFVGALLGVIALAVGATGTSWLTSLAHSPRVRHGLWFETGWYILAFSAIGLAAALALYSLLARKIGSDNLLAGALFVWLGLATAASVYVAGASYLFLWPPLCVLLGWLAVLLKRAASDKARSALLAASGIPAIILIVPMAQKIMWAFSANSTVIVGVLLGLLLALLVGSLRLEQASKRWLLPVSALSAGLGLLIAAISVS
jgi:Peptidase family M28